MPRPRHLIPPLVTEIADDGMVALKITGTDSLGAHVTSTATLYMNGDTQ